MPDTSQSKEDELPLPSPDLEEMVARRVAQTSSRVFPLELGGRELWIKRAARPEFRARVGYGCMRVISFLTRLEILRPRTEPGGPGSLRREALLLNEFTRRGVRVPEVVAFAEDGSWLATGAMGESLGRRAKQASAPGERRELLIGGARALAGLHRAGCVHGAPLPRNLCVYESDTVAGTGNGNESGGERRYGFLDFEDHPEGRMSLPVAQARDVLLYVWGSASWGERDPELLSALLGTWREAAAAPAAWDRVRTHARLGRWVFGPLRPLRCVLGKDLRRAIAAVDALRSET